jgi:hypothetical protein
LKRATETGRPTAARRADRPTAKPVKQSTASNRTRKSAPEKSTAKKSAAKSTAKLGPADALARLRELCLALPETSEKEAWGTPTFRVRGKMFAMFSDDHHGDGRLAVWCKAPLGAQEALVEADPQHFFRPPYVGPSGWVGVHLDKGLAWDEIADILDEGWRTAAPKRLAESRPRKH